MEININGLSPGIPQHDLKAEFERKAEIAAEAKKEVEQKVQQQEQAAPEKEEQKEEPKKESMDMSKFVMSSTDMKELLLLMGSRGKSEAIERMVEVVKKEREMLAKNK
jgi:hypothetical protein